jgi:hypothetical protein
MGFFEFLSEPPSLEERFRHALSVHFQRDKEIHQKLARIQTALSLEIPPEENIILITYGSQLYHDGFGIITDKRVLRFNKKLEDQLTHSEIAVTETYVYPNGNFTVILIGHAAMPYKNFAIEQMSDKVLHVYMQNRVNVSMSSEEAQKDFLRTLKIGCHRESCVTRNTSKR